MNFFIKNCHFFTVGHSKQVLLSLQPFCSRLSLIIYVPWIGLQTQHTFLKTSLQSFTSASTDYINFCLQTSLYIIWLLLVSPNEKHQCCYRSGNNGNGCHHPGSTNAPLLPRTSRILTADSSPSISLARQHNLVAWKKSTRTGHAYTL